MQKQGNPSNLWLFLKLYRWGRLLWIWTALAGGPAGPLPAFAHAQVVRSNPSDQARLPGSPSQLEVWFSELLEDGFNAAEVFPAAQLPARQHTNLVQGSPRVDRQDRTHLLVSVQPLPPGDYVFEWRVLSRDGHSAPGRISFHVLAPKESARGSSMSQSGWNTPPSMRSN